MADNEKLSIKVVVDQATGIVEITNFEKVVAASAKRMVEETRKASQEMSEARRKEAAESKAIQKKSSEEAAAAKKAEAEERKALEKAEAAAIHAMRLQADKQMAAAEAAAAKARADAADAARKDQAAKEEASRRAGLTTFQRWAEDINKSLNSQAEAMARIDPQASTLIQRAAGLAQSFKSAADGGLAGFFSTITLGQKALETFNQYIFEPVKGFSELARSARDMSTILGTNVQDFGALSKAVELNGGSIDIVRQGLGFMTNQLKVAAQTGDLTGTSFARLGISIQNNDGTLKTSTQLFGEIADKLNELPDGMRKAALSVGLFGEEAGAKMLPQLKLGSAGIKAMTSDLVLLTSQVSEADVAFSERFLAAMNRATTAADALSNQLIRGLQRSLVTTMESFANFASGAVKDIIESFGGAEQMVVQLADAFDATKVIVVPFVALAGELSAIFLTLGSVIPIVAGATAHLTAATALLANQMAMVVRIGAEKMGLDGLAESMRSIEAASLNAAIRIDRIGDAADNTAVAMLKTAKNIENYSGGLFTVTDASNKATTSQKALGQAVESSSFLIQRANEEVQKATVALNKRRLTMAQEVAKGEVAARNEVLSAEIAYQTFIRTEAERTSKTLIEKSTEVAKAQDALRMSALTADQDQAIKRAGLQQNLFETEQNIRSQSLNADVQAQQVRKDLILAIGQAKLDQDNMVRNRDLLTLQAVGAAEGQILQAVQAIADFQATRGQQATRLRLDGILAIQKAEFDLGQTMANIDLDVRSRRLELQQSIANASKQRIVDIQTLDLQAAAAVAAKEQETDSLRNQFYINSATREQTLRNIKLAALLELQGKEIANQALKEQLMDRERLKRESFLDVENRLYVQAIETVKARYDEANAQTVLNDLSKRGFDISQLTAQSCGQIANGIGMASQASVSFTSNLQTAASAAQSIMQSAAAAAQSYARGLGGIQSGAAAGVGGGKTITIGGTTLAVPGSSGAAVLSGYEAMYASQNFQQAQTMALALEAAKKRNEEQAALVEKLKTPAQRAAEEQKKQLEAKKQQLQSIPKNAAFNQAMAELDLQIQNAQTGQQIKMAPSLAGLKNQADILAQQSTILDTRRQLGNMSSMASGQNVLDLLNQKKAISDTQRTLSNMDAMASGQNVLDLLSQSASIKNSQRTLSAFDQMASGMNTLDILAQANNVKNSQRTLQNFDRMASGQNVLDLLSQQESIKSAQRTLQNFDAMAAGANVLDLLSQESSIASVARTLSNFSAMASGANTLDLLNQYGQNLTTQRQIGNYGAMTPLLNNADILKAQTSALEIERGAVSDKRMVDWSLFGGGGRPIPQSNGLESLRTSTDPRMIALAQRMGIQRFATGTGLEGVPGSGRGDSTPALLTPREIVLNPAESDVMRTLAKMGGGIDYEKLADALARALEGVSVKADGREIGKLMLKQSRNGQRTTYAPAGLTKAR